MISSGSCLKISYGSDLKKKTDITLLIGTIGSCLIIAWSDY